MKQQAIDLHNQGMTKREIANQLGLGYSTVKKYTQGMKTQQVRTEGRCRDCDETDPLNFYKASRYYCKACWNKRTFQSARDKLDQLIRERGGRCERCGYDRYYGALQWHHLDPTHKEFGISGNRGAPISKLREEVSKCQLLCANCHAEAHAPPTTRNPDLGRPLRTY